MKIHLTVNGRREALDTEARTTLVDALRHQLHLTGTHAGCEHGVCGSCTVILDGAAVRSCLMLAVQADGRSIGTVEGLSPDGGKTLSPLQTAFKKHHALQCGFCTPGLIVAVHHLLENNSSPTEIEVKEALSGNICRCTGYGRIFSAVQLVISQREKGIS